MNASVEVSPGTEGIKPEETEENESGDIPIRVSSLAEIRFRPQILYNYPSEKISVYIL